MGPNWRRGEGVELLDRGLGLGLVPSATEGFVETNDDEELVEPGPGEGVFIGKQLLLGVEDFKIIGVAGAVAFGGDEHGVLVGGDGTGLPRRPSSYFCRV